MSFFRRFFTGLGFSQKKDPWYNLFIKPLSTNQAINKKIWDKVTLLNEHNQGAFKKIIQRIAGAKPLDSTIIHTICNNKEGDEHFNSMLSLIIKLTKVKLIDKKNATPFLNFIANLYTNPKFINDFTPPSNFKDSQSEWIKQREAKLIKGFQLFSRWLHEDDQKNISALPIERYQTIYEAIGLAPDPALAGDFWGDMNWQIFDTKYSTYRYTGSYYNDITDEMRDEIFNHLVQLIPLFTSPYRIFGGFRKNNFHLSKSFTGQIGIYNTQAILNGASPELVIWEPKNQLSLSGKTLAKLFKPCYAFI